MKSKQIKKQKYVNTIMENNGEKTRNLYRSKLERATDILLQTGTIEIGGTPPIESSFKKRISNIVGGRNFVFINLLREALINHRYSAVAAILLLYKQYKGAPNEIAYRGGMRLVEEMGDLLTREELVKSFLKVHGLSSKEVVLNHVVHLIQENHIAEAEEALMTFSSHKLTRGISAPGNKLVNLLTHAYEGLVHFYSWYNLIKDEDKTDDGEQQNLSNVYSTRRLSEQIQNKFAYFVKEPGNWDIFVKKYLFMLLRENRIDDAEAMLNLYVTNNPNSVNAYTYLYEFLNRTNGSQTRILEILKTIAKLDPSSSLVLDLVQKIEPNACQSKQRSFCVKRLFRLLDYNGNKSNYGAWEVFVKLLMEIYERKDYKSIETSKMLWKKRESWWPKFHFQVPIEFPENYRMLCYKAVFAAHFLHHRHSFVRKVRKHSQPKLTRENYELIFSGLPKTILEENKKRKKSKRAKV